MAAQVHPSRTEKIVFEGRDVLRLRLANGLSQQALARMIGVDQAILSGVENSRDPIPIHMQLRVLRALIP